jgi:hypothetical protein
VERAVNEVERLTLHPPSVFSAGDPPISFAMDPAPTRGSTRVCVYPFLGEPRTAQVPLGLLGAAGQLTLRATPSL